jgi:HK97 family phage major capsid protein
MEKMLKRLKEIAQRLNELDTESRSAETTTERLGAINDEVDKLVEERSKLDAEVKKLNKEAFERAGRTIDPEQRDPEAMADEEAEQRLRALKQNRSITLATLDTLAIDHQANGIKGTFNQVSNILDLVTHKYFPGGESYKQAFAKGYAEAGYTAEGGAYTTTEPQWGYAEINKTKITAYTEVSEEFEKLKPSYYLKEIQNNLLISMRKKLAREIIKGDGASGHLTGILAPAANVVALETAKDLEIGTIDEHTLSNIIIGFGGDEDIYRGVLILNKLDLKEFLKVRGSDKKPVYKVDFVNQTIDGVPYIISSHITPHASAGLSAYTMLYGTLGHYDLVSFAPIEMAKSTDFKFSTGQIAYRASGFFGGNVTSFNAFLRVKKPAA